MKSINDWFKKKRGVTIEEQLDQLRRIGITLKENIAVGEILDFERHKYEERPYLYLLMSLGSEYQTEEGSFVYRSDEVWYFDRECIEDHGDYFKIMERIAELVKDDLSLSHIADFVDIENNEAWISFTANGSEYKCNLVVRDDWLDIGIFKYMSKLLKMHGSSKRLFYADIDQHALLVILPMEQYENLNNLLNIFIPFYFAEDGEEVKV